MYLKNIIRGDNCMKKLYIEAPCFGFGPVSTSLAIAKKMEKEYEIIFITYGEALDYLKECTSYKYYEIDTRSEQGFYDLLKIITLDDYIIVNTNVELSCFLLEREYKVLVIDTLYWMWNQVPEEYTKNQNIIAQVYFGRGIGQLPPKEECKPIIDYNVWKKSEVKNSDCALISFGGMSEPADSNFILASAQLILDKIVTNLPDNVKIVYVLGGLFPKRKYEFNNKCVEVLGTVNNVKHRELVEECKYLFYSPGLTSLYEMLSSERLVCLLPGLCVSQIYQIYDFHNYFEYPHCIMWKEYEELINHFDEMPELEGLAYLHDYLLNHASLNDIDIQAIISEYAYAVDHGVNGVQKEKRYKIFNCKSVDELVPLYLNSMDK